MNSEDKIEELSKEIDDLRNENVKVQDLLDDANDKINDLEDDIKTLDQKLEDSFSREARLEDSLADSERSLDKFIDDMKLHLTSAIGTRATSFDFNIDGTILVNDIYIVKLIKEE